MQLNDLFTEIGRVLSSSESAQVQVALRQDPLIWKSLEQADFFQMVVGGIGSQVNGWNPGQMALLALGESRSAEMLRAEPMPALGQALQERALQTYQAVQRTGKAPTALRDAALLALALRERRRLTGTWSGLLQEILPRQANQDTQPLGAALSTAPTAASSAAASAAFATWRTPLACLYGLVPDPEEMLRGLLPRNPNRVSFDWIAHVQLCQPLSESEHIAAFTRLLKGLPVVFQLGLLRSLSLHGSEPIAAALAGNLLVGHPAFANLRAQTNSNPVDLASLSSRALALQQMGAFYHLSGDRAQALSLYNAAETTLEQWLAGLFLQRLNLQVGSEAGELDALVENDHLCQLAAASGWLKNELGVVLVSHPYASSILDQMPGDSSSAYLQLKRARQMFEYEPAVARDLARQGANGLLAEVGEQGVPFNGDFVFTWRPGDAITILLELDLAEEALDLVLALLAVRPVDIHLIDLSGKIYERLSKLDQALQAAQNTAGLDPLNPNWRRRLGSLLGQAGEWARSFVEWQAVLSLTVPSLPTDRLACAQAAFQAGEFDQAVELSQSALQDDPNNGVALGLLGQALVARGELRHAINYLVRATLLAPEALAPWLTLARVQRELGEPQRALETLRAAVTAVPEAPEGHLALGEACISAGLLAEALPHLKKAFLLSPEAAQSALLYGQTLRILGHAAEARAVLERVRSSWNNFPELAYEYAQVLLDLNNAENALPVLEMALRCGLPVLDGYLLYARILLGEYRTGDEAWASEIASARMQQADQALRHILEVNPQNLEARFLMADILREKGDLDEALVAYRALADSPDSGGPDLRWRVQWGLGQTALRLGQIGTALVALKEVCQAKPENFSYHRALAEASLQAQLPKEALEAAVYALQLASNDVETLTWFADFVTRAGEPRRAVEALERAIQLDLSRADLRVNLAVSQLAAGDLGGARASLEAVKALENVNRADLRRAAQAYLRLEDLKAALDFFNRALAAEPGAPADLLFEVARLQNRLGSYEAALELAQQAAEDTCESLPVHLLQADLLARLNRPQAALAVLEHALRVAQSAQYPLEREERPAMKRIMGEIHERFTTLMLQAGDLPAALHHAERALSINTDSAALCCRAADLALSQLQTERAARIVKSFQMGDADGTRSLLAYGQDGLELISLKIEMALDYGQHAEAAAWIEEVLDKAPNKARLLAAQARLLARQHDLTSARQIFEMAGKQADGDSPLWLAEAALEVQRWKEALAIAERYAQAHLNEARAQLTFARMLVLCAEQQRFCEALNCRTNAPGASMLSETARQKFEDAIHDALRLVNIGEVGRWQARGQAVFAPSAQTARALASMPAQAEDTAALIFILYHLNNRAAAAQVARRHAEHPQVLLHLALCALGDPSVEGLEIAEQAVSANPSQPLAHVILARLAAQVGELSTAILEYQNALTIWPDEPQWHDAVADLCLLVGDLVTGILHCKQAVTLDPNNAVFAYKSGQASLTDEDISGAIIHLEKSTSLDPDQSEVWLTLATAYHMAGRLPQAVEAARKASELNPSSAEGLLIAGETALSMNQTEQALEFAQSAVRREPENAVAVLFLSNVLVQCERPADGLEVLEETSPAVKAVFPVAFERAKLIRRLHGPQAALEVLEKITKDHPEEPGLLGYLARIQAECGDPKSAERYAFKALRLDPNQPDLTLMLGRLQRKTGQLDQAVYLLGEVIRMAPDNLESHLELGSVYQERREFDLALQVYRRAMQIAPGDYQAFYQSGLILRDSKDYGEAESMLRRAAELAPDNLSIRRQLVGVIALNLVHHKQEAPAL